MKHVALFFAGLTIINAALAESDDIGAQIHALTDAMIAADADALKKITATELSYGHSSGRVEDQATFIANLVSGASDFVSIKLLDQRIQRSRDIAIVRHTLVATTNDSGKPGDVKIGVMLVWQIQKNEWRLLARQAFKL